MGFPAPDNRCPFGFCLKFESESYSKSSRAKHKTSRIQEAALYPETDLSGKGLELSVVKTLHFLVLKTDKMNG